MKTSVQLPVLLSLSLILIAQAAFAPLFLTVIFVWMLLTTFQHFRTLKVQPNHQVSRVLKLVLVFLSLLSIYFSYRSFIGVEAGTAFLAVFLFAKALELKSKRDLIILFNFALFVSASLFLYSQSIWMAILVIACLISCLFGLYRIQTVDF